MTGESQVLSTCEQKLMMHIRTISSQALRAAALVNDAPMMPRDAGNIALSDALHSLLIIAEECRQASRVEVGDAI